MSHLHLDFRSSSALHLQFNLRIVQKRGDLSMSSKSCQTQWNLMTCFVSMAKCLPDTWLCIPMCFEKQECSNLLLYRKLILMSLCHFAFTEKSDGSAVREVEWQRTLNLTVKKTDFILTLEHWLMGSFYCCKQCQQLK